MVNAGKLVLKSGDEQRIVKMVFVMVLAHALITTVLKIKEFSCSFTFEWE